MSKSSFYSFTFILGKGGKGDLFFRPILLEIYNYKNNNYMVTIERTTFNYCKFTFDKKNEFVIIRDTLRFWNEGAYFSQKFKDKVWDGYNYFFHEKSQTFLFGYKDEVLNSLKKYGIKYKYIDSYFEKNKTNIVQEKINIEIPENMEERFYQTEAVKKFFKYNKGIIVVPTRGGKTFITFQCIRQIENNYKDFVSLIVVDSISLFNQTVTEIAKFLKVDESEIGKINGDNFYFKKVNIAMSQTLNSINGKDTEKCKQLLKFLKTVKFLTIDEIQDNSSDSRINCYKKCTQVKFLLGLSATPFKQMDFNLSMKIKGFYGNVVYKVSKKRLQKEGYLSMDKAILITNDSFEVRGDSYNDFLIKNIHKNEERNFILHEVIRICRENNWKTLFLFNSKKFGRYLSIKENITFLDGDTKIKDRNFETKKFLDKKGGILFASNIFKKGITLPEVEICFIADGGLEGSNLIQKLGRMLGTTKDKTRSIIIDVMDLNSNYFKEHSLNRLEVYDKEIGKKRIEIYSIEEINQIEESIKEWLHVNK